MNRRKIILIITTVTLLIITFYKTAETFKKSKIPTVTQIHPQNRTITATVSATGAIMSEQQAKLSFATSGKIIKLTAKEGEEVKKGQILGQLNTYSATQSAQSAKDARDIALRNRDLFIEQYQSNKDAVGGEKEYEIKLRTLNERISQANANYNATLGQLSNYYIKAPFDGVILKLNNKVGETVSPTQIVYEIANLNDLYFETKADQEDIGNITIGQKAMVTLDSHPNKELSATVYDIGKKSNPDDTFTLKLSIDDMKKITPIIGMTGDVRLITGQTENPVQSLAFDEYFKDKDGFYVWTVTDETKLKKLRVGLGLEGDVYTEIKTDLSGYKIVVPAKNTKDIEEGMIVKITDE